MTFFLIRADNVSAYCSVNWLYYCALIFAISSKNKTKHKGSNTELIFFFKRIRWWPISYIKDPRKLLEFFKANKEYIISFTLACSRIFLMLVMWSSDHFLSYNQTCQDIKEESSRLWASTCSLENVLVLWYSQTPIC